MMPSRLWWVMLARGVLGLLLGLLLLMWPQQSAEALVMLIGAFITAIGLAIIVLAVVTRFFGWGAALGSGLITLAVGLIALFAPGAVAALMVWIVAAWAIVIGVIELISASAMRGLNMDATVVLIVGIISLVFGLILIIWPGVGVVAAAWLIGLYFLVTGILLLWQAVRLRGTVAVA